MNENEETTKIIRLGIQFDLDIAGLAGMVKEEQELIVATFMHESAVQIETAIRMELLTYKAGLN